MLKRAIRQCRNTELNSGAARTSSWCQRCPSSEPCSVSAVASRAPTVPLCTHRGWLTLPVAGADHGTKGRGCLSRLFFFILAPNLCSVRFPDFTHRFKLLPRWPSSALPLWSKLICKGSWSTSCCPAVRREGKLGGCMMQPLPVVHGWESKHGGRAAPAQSKPTPTRRRSLVPAQLTTSPFLAQGWGNPTHF